MDEENVDWDAFAILSADPEIDAATAYAASIRDEPPQQQQQPPNKVAGLIFAGIIIALAIAIALMAL